MHASVFMHKGIIWHCSFCGGRGKALKMVHVPRRGWQQMGFYISLLSVSSHHTSLPFSYETKLMPEIILSSMSKNYFLLAEGIWRATKCHTGFSFSVSFFFSSDAYVCIHEKLCKVALFSRSLFISLKLFRRPDSLQLFVGLLQVLFLYCDSDFFIIQQGWITYAEFVYWLVAFVVW